MTKKKTGVSSRKTTKLAPITTSKRKAPRRRAPKTTAISIACPSCGAAPMQACLLLSGAMGHRRRLEEALKFNCHVAHAPALHAARTAAWRALSPKGSSPRPR